jgi:Kef-type K+ transport system membrane component KefB
MQNVWALASLWVGLALIATLLAIWFKISTALSEIVVGTVAQLIIGAIVGPMGLAAKSEWITFLAGTGAIVLTFLAGAELDPIIFRTKWKEAVVVGLVGFFGPFLGCTAVAHFVLLDGYVKLACWRGPLDDVCCSRVRRDAGTWTQQDRIR